MRELTVALAKGRLANKAMDLFEQIGISCEEMKDKDSRKLIFENKELGMRFFWRRPMMFRPMWSMGRRISVSWGRIRF